MANQIKYKVGFDVDNKSLKSLRDQLLQLQKMTSKDFMKINPGSSLSQAQKELQQIKNTAKQVDQALDKAFNSKLGTINLTDFKRQLSGLPINKIYNDFSKMGATGQAAFRSLSTQMLTVNTRIRQSHSLLDKMATTLGNTLKWNIASNAINGMTRSIDQAWGYVKSLDGSLNDIRIVTGKSSDEMANFAIQANEAAKSLGKTTTDYTKASLIYAQQGLNDEEVAARAAITLKAANVTGQSTDDVSEQLTAVWNGYKVTADQAELYVDRLAAVAATTASDLEELSTGMSKVASAAAAMGVGEDQLAAQLSTIISVTKQAPESVGTALRTVYARISDIKAGIDEDGVTLGNYSGKMAELGFNVLDTAGNLRDMGQVMEQIGGRWQDLTREQQVNLAQTMAGQRQYNNLLALFDNFEAYNKALNTAQNAAGTLQQQQDIYMESTVAHLNTLKASVEDVYDSFMNRDSLDTVNDLIDALSKVSTLGAGFIDSLGGGMNILSSLGSLGVTVFSRQIAGSIQTTINNLNRGRQQAQAFKDALANAEALEKSGQGNDYTRYLSENQKSLLQMGNKLSTEDFNAIQKNIQDLSAAANQVDILNEKIDVLENTFQELGPVINEDIQGWKTLDQALASADGIQIIKNSLNDFKNAFNPSLESLNKLQQQLQIIKNINPNDTQGWPKYRHELKLTSEAANELISTLQNQSFNGQTLLNFLPKNVVTSVEQAKKAISGLNWNNLKASQAKANAQVIENAFQQLRSALYNRISEINTALRSMNEQNPQNLEKLKNELAAATQAVQELQGNLDGLNTKAASNIQIQSYVKLAGGIAQVGSAIQQVQHLGSIWANDDLTSAEKLLQTITNIAMVIPQFVMGFQSINEVLNLFKVSQIEATVATTAAATAEGERATATSIATAATVAAKETTEELIKREAVQVITAKAAAKAELERAAAMLTANTAGGGVNNFITSLTSNMQKFLPMLGGANTGLGSLGAKLVGLINPGTAVIGVFAGLAAVLLIYHAHQEKIHKQTIENLKTDINEANKKQQLINKNKELTNSVEDLNNKYQNGEITRAELRNSIQDLIDQYGIEDEHIISLITRYDNLTEAVKKLKTEAAGQLLESTKLEAQKAEKLLIETAKDNGRIWEDQQGKQKFSTTIRQEGLNKKSLQLINEMGGILDPQNLTYTITIDANVESFTTFQEKITEMQQSYSETQRIGNRAYDSIKNTASSMSQAINMAATSAKELNNAIAGNIGENQDFSNIDSFAKYQQVRQAIINKVKGEEGFSGNETDAAFSVDNYLSQNQMDLFNQFDEGIQKLDEFKEKFGESNQQVEKFVKNLSKENLNKFVQLNPDIITNWDQLLYILQHIGEIDLENITKVGDIQARNKENLDNFKKYDEVKQSVSQGKEIKEEDYAALPQTLQQFFTYAGDGMYKLAENAKGFYDAIDDLKLQGFQDTIQAIQGEIQNLQQVKAGLQEGKFSSADLKQSAIQENGAGFGVSTVNNDLLDRQIEYLNAAVTKGSEEEAILKEIQSHNVKTIQDAQQIYDLISQIGDKTKDTDQNLKNYNNSLKQQYQQLHDAMFPTDEDVDAKKLQALSDQLQGLAEQSDALADSLKSDGRTAEDVAQALLRFSDATKDVADNYDDWMKALSSGSIGDQVEVIDDLRDAYADLLDFPEDAFSDQFLTSADNLNLLKEAANGSTEAYDQLMQAAQQDIATQVGLDTTAFDAAFDSLMDQYYQGQNLEDMQIGASLNDEGFLQGLTDMVNAAGMTAQQATAYLASMGVDAQVIEQDTEAEEVTEAAGYTAHFTQKTAPFAAPIAAGAMFTSQPLQYIAQNLSYEPNPTSSITKKQNKAFSLKVTSAHKSSGGAFKYSNAPGKKSYSGGKGSGGGGGGGGGGGSKPDTSKKDVKKPLKSEKDPYHDINIKLRDINDQLEKMEKHQERLWGKQAFDNLNKQNELLEDQLDALKEKNKIQRQELSKQRKDLQGRGVTFDANGNISNYTSILQQQESKIQAMYDQYNKWVKKYNESTDADYKKGISEAMSDYDKQIKEEETVLKELKSDIDKYDKTQEEIQKNLDEQDETNQKIIENNIKKFRMQLEIRLDTGKAERDWNQFRRKVLEKTDVLKGTEFDNIFGDAIQNFRDLFSYFDTGGSMGIIQKLTNQLYGTLDQIKQIDKTGTSAIYGDNKAQAMEDLQDDLEELMTQLEDIEDLIDAIDQAYLDTIDDIQEQFDKQIEDYEYVQQLLENDIDLLTLLYGDKNFQAMQNYYDQMYNNSVRQLDSLSKQRNFWKEQWDQAVARGDTNAAEKFEQNYKNAISNINSVIQDSIQNLKDSYSNALAEIFYNQELQLTSGKGFDFIQDEWDLINKNADEYLDTINAAFAVQDTQRKYQKALNDTKDIKNQQTLKKLMNEQLDILKNKEKITQYDIDRAQKLLEVEQARIALEDARSAKTSMRLKRDSQGNYSYEYYADEQGIGEAEENYANARQNLGNLDAERYRQIGQKFTATIIEYFQKLQQLRNNDELSESEKLERERLLNEQYQEYLTFLTEQHEAVRLNLSDSTFQNLAYLYNTDVENYKAMAKQEQDVIMESIVPNWNDGVALMIDKIANTEGGLSATMQGMFGKINTLSDQFKKKLDELAETAGIDFGEIQNGIDDTATSLSDLIEDNDELITKMSEELTAITDLKNAADELKQAYKNVQTEAINAVTQIQNFIREQQNQAADYIANQQAMADAQSDAYAQVADAYVAAINKIRAAIDAANSSSNSGSPSGSNPSGTSPGSNNPAKNTSAHGALTHWEEREFGGGFATGGYTGNWNSDEGRIALLHEKELVLNKEDTTNILDAVKIIRSLNDNVSGKAYNINTSLTNGKTQSNDNKETIEQDVHITATFPNVNTKKEIEEAFNELANRAAQRVLKR